MAPWNEKKGNTFWDTLPRNCPDLRPTKFNSFLYRHPTTPHILSSWGFLWKCRRPACLYHKTSHKSVRVSASPSHRTHTRTHTPPAGAHVFFPPLGGPNCQLLVSETESLLPPLSRILKRWFPAACSTCDDAVSDVEIQKISGSGDSWRIMSGGRRLMVNDQTGALGNAGKCRMAEEERLGLHTNAALWILISLLVLSIRVVNFHIQYSNIMKSHICPLSQPLCSHLQCTEVTFGTGWIRDDEKIIHRRFPVSERRSCGQTGNLRSGLPFIASYTFTLLPGSSRHLKPVVSKTPAALCFLFCKKSLLDWVN